jgi:hypothetical protein
MYQILIFAQLKVLDLVGLSLLLLLQSFLGLHRPHPSDLLVGLNPRLLEALYCLFQLLPNARVFPRQFDYPAQAIFSPYPQLAQLVI